MSEQHPAEKDEAGQRSVLSPGVWDDDPNHPEGFDCHGEPLSSGERCGRKQHAPYVIPPAKH